MKIKKNIPNFLTCMNLLCGCFAIYYAYSNQLDFAAWLIGIAAIFDFLDGMVARLLKVHSEIGKQLDSLADMVTFGVVPGTLTFMLIKNTTTEANYYLIGFSFLIPVFSAIRLAKFNIDTRQSDSFIGLPTPANAMLIGSFPLILKYQPAFLNITTTLLHSPYFFAGLSILMSYLMVAELPLFALKFKNFGWQDNRERFLFLGISLLLLISFHFVAIPIILFLYVILSVVTNFKKV